MGKLLSFASESLLSKEDVIDTVKGIQLHRGNSVYNSGLKLGPYKAATETQTLVSEDS